MGPLHTILGFKLEMINLRKSWGEKFSVFTPTCMFSSRPFPTDVTLGPKPDNRIANPTFPFCYHQAHVLNYLVTQLPGYICIFSNSL